MTLACVGGKKSKMVKMSRGLHIQADKSIEECMDKNYDVIVLPGVRVPIYILIIIFMHEECDTCTDATCIFVLRMALSFCTCTQVLR